MTEAPDLLLGVDLGAGSLKAVLIDADGRVHAQASSPVRTRYPHPGWVEQAPDDWRRALFAAIGQVLDDAGRPAARIRALAVSGGAHTPVLLDRAHRPLRPAILWSDQRAAEEAVWLRERHGALIERQALNRANPTWTLPMLAWLRRHEPRRLARARRLCLAKDYLRWLLTGTWETDYADAVGALLVDDARRDWSPALCALIDWPPNALPPIRPADAIAGGVTAEAARATGLHAGTPVAVGSNDTTVELFGAGCLAPGQAAIKLASSAVLSLPVDGPRVLPPVSCYPHLPPGVYYLATGSNACASAQRWAQRRFFGDAAGGAAAMEAAAAAAPPGSDGLLFHPYLLGERAPLWDPRLRGDFLGLTMRHDTGHCARAVYEGVAFSIRDMLEDLRARGLTVDRARLIGGGSRSAVWRQAVADITGLPLTLPAATDASFGSALLAGIACGVYPSPRAAAERAVTTTRRVLPRAALRGRYDALYELYRHSRHLLAPISHRLHALAADSDSDAGGSGVPVQPADEPPAAG